MDKLSSETVSAVKAVGILLMVSAHSGCPGWLGGYIGTFHMPLFFLMSGYCFKTSYLSDAKTFVKRKMTGIWWPFVKWALFFLVLHNLFIRLNIINNIYGYEEAHMLGWREFLVTVLNILRLLSNGQLLGGYWFVKELFWASLISYVCIRYIRSFTYRGGVILLILLVTGYTNYGGVPIIGLWDRTWMATLFFMIGHEWRKAEEKYSLWQRFSNMPTLGKVGLIVLMGVIPSVIAHAGGAWGMLGFTTNQAIPYMIGAVCGTMMVFCLGRLYMSRATGWGKKFLLFTGQHTFEVLTWHFLCFKIVSLIIIGVYGLPIERLATFPNINATALRSHGVEFNLGWWPWWWAYLAIGAGVPLTWQWLRLRWKAKRQGT